MKPVEQGSGAATSLEEELLRMLARQARRIPIPVFLAAVTIAAIASDHVPAWTLIGWLGLVTLVLVIRWYVLAVPTTLSRVAPQTRLRIALALSALNGVTHGLSLAFFPVLPGLERALQSMVMIGLCAGSVATTAGYMPVLLAYLLPTLGPLSVMWLLAPDITSSGWIEKSTAALLALLSLILVALGKDASRLFRESFAIRREQAELNRQLELALQQAEAANRAKTVALEQAEAANRAKTRFLASASHDLRQPIHTLSLFGGALSMRTLDPESRRIVQRMNTALGVLTSQLDSLLDISKLDAKVMHVSRSAVALRPFLERMQQEFAPAARTKGLAFTLDCPRDAIVTTDPMLLERIVRNLLDNAIKYTDRGGVSISAARAAEAILVDIADTGRGIPEEEQKRVFEEFYQLGNPERDRTKGLGLGLAIVQRLADLLQIDWRMDSAPGRGTRFRLTMIERVEAEARRLKRCRTPRPRRNWRLPRRRCWSSTTRPRYATPWRRCSRRSAGTRHRSMAPSRRWLQRACAGPISSSWICVCAGWTMASPPCARFVPCIPACRRSW
jgi:two-component system, sensor histidine kinase